MAPTPRISVRRRFWVEVTLAGIATLLFLVTALWPRWFESLFGVEPDGGDGSFERWIALSFAVMAAAAALAARFERRRVRTATA